MARGDLVLAADSHLNAEGGDTSHFLRFLRDVGPTAETLILVGDIFDLWIARDGLEMPFHSDVVRELGELRRAGVRLKYVQGNRDYFVAERYGSNPFEEVAEDSLDLRHAGRSIHVSHGDLVNLEDRQYQTWRRFSRSSPVRTVFGALPTGVAGRLSSYLERRFRTTNARYRIGFPEAQAEAYARRVFAAGADTIVLGHFHQRRTMEVDGERRLYVLPGWREDHAHLRFDASGNVRFEDFKA